MKAGQGQWTGKGGGTGATVTDSRQAGRPRGDSGLGLKCWAGVRPRSLRHQAGISVAKARRGARWRNPGGGQPAA